MKLLKIIPRPFMRVVLVIFIFLLSVGIYIVGTKTTSENKDVRAKQACTYTQDDLNEIYDKYKNTVRDFNELEEEEINKLSANIEALEGECADVALNKAFDLGIATYRNLTDCWNNCVLTEDYSYRRLNFAIKDRRMIHMSIG